MAESALLVETTGQSRVEDAVHYIAEGNFLPPAADLHRLLGALCNLQDVDDVARTRAIRRLAREVSRSELNTAEVLLQPELVTPPSVYRRALDHLATKTASKTLRDVTYRAVHIAQREDANVLSSLAAVAGLSWRELQQRADGALPDAPTGSLPPEVVKTAFKVIDAIVNDAVSVDLPGGFAARPVELLGDPDITADPKKGWSVIEALRVDGVPYESLLAQRVEGGYWRQHRDRIGGKYAHVLADRLCGRLDVEQLNYFRSKKCGGPVRASEIGELVGGKDQVAVLVLANGKPWHAIAISVAKDGGSASKSGVRLCRNVGKVDVPMSVLVAGKGWAERNETADLAVVLAGRVFSELRIDELVRHIVDSLPEEEP